MYLAILRGLPGTFCNYHRIDANKVKTKGKVSPRRKVTAEPYDVTLNTLASQ